MPTLLEPIVRSTFCERFHTCLKKKINGEILSEYEIKKYVLYDGSTPLVAERRRLISIRSQTRSTCPTPQSFHAKSGSLQKPPIMNP